MKKQSPSNYAVADVLERHGKLLEIAGESPFRTRAYSRAAEAIRAQKTPLSDISSREDLRAIPGVGEGIATAISELLRNGSFSAHDELKRQYPESLIELITVPGVGVKTALKLFTLLGVDSIDALDQSLTAGKIATTKGLGSRVEVTVREGLAALRRRTGRSPLGVALPLARVFVEEWSRLRPHETISVAGSVRRWDVTVGDLNFVVASSEFSATAGAFSELSLVTTSEQDSASTIQLGLVNGLRATVLLTDPETWGSALVRATGNAAHLKRLGTMPESAATEEEVYAARGIPWIPPELRNGEDEFERWAEIPALVQINDINGEFHTHTTWSDGGASIEAMANAAAERGYEFLGITDHSHGLGVAGGLDVKRLAEQKLELDALDGVSGIRLLAGAEVEVHRDGSLDYDDQTLANLDVVVASLHTGLRQPREMVTARLVRVLQNPNVDIIAHPSGRLIERREGGDFDWDEAFAVAAQTGTALEINADPARLDLDPALARRASDAGCLITVNCDAHSPSGFAQMDYGVMMARKAWLTPERILNCWPRSRVLEWLAARGQPA
jgi:DNA polymerase (family X)